MNMQLSSRDRYRILAGSTFRLALAVDEQLRVETTNGALPAADDPAAAIKGQTFTAGADGVEIEINQVGQYHLAWRKSAAATAWSRAGAIDALPIVDTREQALRDELAYLSARLGEIAAIQHDVSDPSGTRVLRSNLAQLRRQRANAETRLEDLLRRRRGLAPARFQR